MERDYFKDRSYAYEYNNLLEINNKVYICEKQMQTTASQLKDLTKGVIIHKLTSAPIHHAGIKVEIQVDNEQRKAIGRVVYLLDEEDMILTCDRSRY